MRTPAPINRHTLSALTAMPPFPDWALKSDERKLISSATPIAAGRTWVAEYAITAKPRATPTRQKLSHVFLRRLLEYAQKTRADINTAWIYVNPVREK
jgi:hypothetical protein